MKFLVLTFKLSKEQSEFLGMLSIGCVVLSLCGRVFVPLFVVFPRVFIMIFNTPSACGGVAD